MGEPLLQPLDPIPEKVPMEDFVWGHASSNQFTVWPVWGAAWQLIGLTIIIGHFSGSLSFDALMLEDCYSQLFTLANSSYYITATPKMLEA